MFGGGPPLPLLLPPAGLPRLQLFPRAPPRGEGGGDDDRDIPLLIMGEDTFLRCDMNGGRDGGGELERGNGREGGDCVGRPLRRIGGDSDVVLKLLLLLALFLPNVLGVGIVDSA